MFNVCEIVKLRITPSLILIYLTLIPSCDGHICGMDLQSEASQTPR